VSTNFHQYPLIWLHVGCVVTPAFSAERMARTYTAKPLFDTGALVSFSSDDWTLDVLSPFLGMQVGHNRQYPREMLVL
jgi:predicted amidohydrolase YtcJ